MSRHPSLQMENLQAEAQQKAGVLPSRRGTVGSMAAWTSGGWASTGGACTPAILTPDSPTIASLSVFKRGLGGCKELTHWKRP